MKTFEEAINTVVPKSLHHSRFEDWSKTFETKYGRTDDLVNSPIHANIVAAAQRIIEARFMSPNRMAFLSLNDFLNDLIAFGLCCTEIGIAVGMEMEKGELL